MSSEVRKDQPIVHYLNSISENNFRASKLFPTDTKIVHFESLSDKSYTAILRLTCCSKEEFRVWLAEYERLSNNKFRVGKTIPRAGKTVVYKAMYRCERNQYPSSHRGRLKKPSKKDTGCRARLNISIKSSVKGRVCKSKDFLRTDYPTIVNIYHCHNHDTDMTTTVKQRNQDEDTQKTFIITFPRKTRNNENSLTEVFVEDSFGAIEEIGEIICSPGKTLSNNENNLVEEFVEDSFSATKKISEIICTHINKSNIKEEFIEDSFSTTEDIESYSDNGSCDSNMCDKFTGKLEHMDESAEKQIEWKDIELKWNHMMFILKKKFSDNPSDFACAIDSMHSKFISLDNSPLISAMYNFGKS